MTPAEALRRGAQQLESAGVPDAAWDAEVLLRHILGWDRAALVVNTTTPLTDEAEAAFFQLIAERARRRPLQHLTGAQAFWRHKFLVTREVLIPRRETELIVETVLGLLCDVARPFVADVGTGSGCIALSLAADRPDAVVHATDISATALEVACENARRIGLAGRVSFHQGDLLEPLAALEGRFDAIAANPPYVDPVDGPTLAPEVRDHEPALALFSPGGVCSIYERLAPQAWRFLRHGGVLVVEIGMGMDSAVASICESAGLRVERVIKDLQSIPRTLVARRP